VPSAASSSFTGLPALLTAQRLDVVKAVRTGVLVQQQ
jgi:hypothetical protein